MNRYISVVQRERESVWNLTSNTDTYSVGRTFQVVDVQNSLEGELIKIEAFSLVVVRRDGLGVVVDHARVLSKLAHRSQSGDGAIIKFNRAANLIRSSTKDDSISSAKILTKMTSDTFCSEIKQSWFEGKYLVSWLKVARHFSIFSDF